MRGRARAATRVTVAAVVAAAAVAGGMAAARDTGGDDVPVTVMFTDASPLIPGNVVRMNGVQVGLIRSIELRNGQAAVRMDLDRSVLPLQADASAKIRPVTLLGERFVEIDRGSPNAAEMAAPRVIPAHRTSRAVDLDEVLNSLDDPTSTALAALVTALGEGTAGQGGKIDAALRALGPAMRDTQRLGAVLDQQNAVLDRLGRQVTPVAQAIAGGNGRDLDRLAASAERMLAAVSAERAALDAALVRLPQTLDKAQRVLLEAAGVAEVGTADLKAIRPVTGDLAEITRELDAFSAAAGPALASLPPVLNRAKALLDEAAPAVRDLRPGTAALPAVGASAHRLVGDLTPHFKTVLDFVRYWAMSTNGRDGLSNYFRAFVVTTPKSLLQIPGTGVPGPTPKPTAEPDQDAAAASTPALPPLLTGGGDSGSATGLDSEQETSLLDQLLGGR